MDRIVLTLDDIVSSSGPERVELEQTLEIYRARGFEIILALPEREDGSRNEHGIILPARLADQLKSIDLHFDSVVIGMPCANPSILFVDDRSVTLKEFCSGTPATLGGLIQRRGGATA